MNEMSEALVTESKYYGGGVVNTHRVTMLYMDESECHQHALWYKVWQMRWDLAIHTVVQLLYTVGEWQTTHRVNYSNTL